MKDATTQERSLTPSQNSIIGLVASVNPEPMELSRLWGKLEYPDLACFQLDLGVLKEYGLLASNDHFAALTEKGREFVNAWVERTGLTLEQLQDVVRRTVDRVVCERDACYGDGKPTADDGAAADYPGDQGDETESGLSRETYPQRRKDYASAQCESTEGLSRLATPPLGFSGIPFLVDESTDLDFLARSYALLVKASVLAKESELKFGERLHSEIEAHLAAVRLYMAHRGAVHKITDALLPALSVTGSPATSA